MQRVADLLRRHLAQVLPLVVALIVAELDLVGFDGAEERVEFEVFNLVAIDADLFAPFLEQADPFAEGPDSCYFPRHDCSNSMNDTQRLAKVASWDLAL